MSSTNLNNTAETAADLWLAAVKEEVAGLRFGTVQVIVHEGEVVQIERVSRRRLGPGQSSNRNLSPRSAKN
ncbi:MAG TPA: YezD family protein [Verrucomicrobiae bacterium]